MSRLHFKEIHTTLISVLHPGDRIPERRAQAEACQCAIVVRVDNFPRENFLVVGRLRLAVIKTLVGGASCTSEVLISREILTYNNHHMSTSQVGQTSERLPVHMLLSFRSSMCSVCFQHRSSPLHCHHKACYSRSPMTRVYLRYIWHCRKNIAHCIPWLQQSNHVGSKPQRKTPR